MAHHRRRTHAALALASAGALLVAGCSSSSSNSSSSTSPTSTSAASSPAAPAATAGPATPKARPPVPSTGCGRGSTPAVHRTRRTVDVAGAARWYLLSTPAPRPTPLPLVVDLHGLAEGATAHVAMSELDALGATAGFAVATPNGTGAIASWKAGGTPVDNPDITFMTTMLDRIEADACIDTARVYATGLSDGALFSSLLACRIPERFAAIAPVAGVAVPKPCPSKLAMPVLAFHGTQDPILKFNGGVGDALTKIFSHHAAGPTTTSTTVPVQLNGTGYPAAAAEWATRDGCDPTPVDQQVTASVIHRRFRCPAGVAVEMFIVIGGGHAWPGSKLSAGIHQVVGLTTFDINASAEIWKFFQRFSR